MKNLLLFLSLLTAISANCFAEGRHYSETSGVGIIQYSTGPQAYANLKTAVPTSILSCTKGGSTVRWELDTKTGREFYSTALAAYAAGKKIELYFNSGANCLSDWPEPTSFGLSD